MLEDAGIFAIVLEQVTEEAAQIISQRLTIPVIGIGSGRYCDGQILVVNDLLGLNDDVPLPAKAYTSLNGKLRDMLHGLPTGSGSWSVPLRGQRRAYGTWEIAEIPGPFGRKARGAKTVAPRSASPRTSSTPADITRAITNDLGALPPRPDFPKTEV